MEVGEEVMTVCGMSADKKCVLARPGRAPLSSPRLTFKLPAKQLGLYLY